MAKYSEKLVNQIVELIEQDTFTTSQICNIMRISRKTFYEWMETKPEFKQEIEQARERCDEQLLMNARLAWQRKISGYTLSETIITYVPDDNEPTGFRVKKKVVKTKDYPPDTRSIKEVLERNEKQEIRKRYIESQRPKKTPEQIIWEFKDRSMMYDEQGTYIGREEYWRRREMKEKEKEQIKQMVTV